MKRVLGRIVRAPWGAGLFVAVAATAAASHAARARQGAPAPAPAPAATSASSAFLLRDDCGIDFVHRRFMTPGKKYLNEVMGSGAGLLDYDGDGRLDVYCVQCCPLPGYPGKVDPPPDLLYHNDGKGPDGRVRFSRVPDVVTVKNKDGTTTKKKLGLGDLNYGMAVTCPDVDNDGDPDLFITNVCTGPRYRDKGNGVMQFVSNGGRDTLYRNDGDGTFTDVTDKSGIADDYWSGPAGWADLDGDGDLDLYLGNYAVLDFEHYQPCATKSEVSYCHPDTLKSAPDRLFRNDGGFKFVEVTKEAGIVEAGRGGKALAVLPFDWDDDGKLDLYVANDADPNYLWHNLTGPDGKLRFEEVAGNAGVAVDGRGRPQSCMGSDFADVNGDLRLDLLSANFGREGSVLYVRGDDGTYDDRSVASGIYDATLLSTGFGARFFDFDRDADMDLIQVNGHVLDNVHDIDEAQTFEQMPLLLENQGAGKFVAASERLGPWSRQKALGRGLALGDLDDDGDQDVVVLENDGPLRVLENVLETKNHWIGFKLVGTRSPRDAIGARVLLTCGDKKQVQQVIGSSSYFSWQDLRLYFGVGARTGPATAEIRWPSGKVQTVEKLALDAYHTVVEEK